MKVGSSKGSGGFGFDLSSSAFLVSVDFLVSSVAFNISSKDFNFFSFDIVASW
jgi:hypothetical protein